MENTDVLQYSKEIPFSKPLKTKYKNIPNLFPQWEDN